MIVMRNENKTKLRTIVLRRGLPVGKVFKKSAEMMVVSVSVAVR